VSDYNNREPEPSDNYGNLVLMKFDESGSYLWNKTIPDVVLWDDPGELHIVESQILFSYPGHIKCFDLDGNELWEADGVVATAGEDGNIYSVQNTGQEIAISQISPSGNTTWSTLFGIEYEPEWIEILQAHDITITPEDELLILAQGARHDDSYHLVKFDLNGAHIQT